MTIRCHQQHCSDDWFLLWLQEEHHCAAVVPLLWASAGQHLHSWAEYPRGQLRQLEEVFGGRPSGETHTYTQSTQHQWNAGTLLFYCAALMITNEMYGLNVILSDYLWLSLALTTEEISTTLSATESSEANLNRWYKPMFLSCDVVYFSILPPFSD